MGRQVRVLAEGYSLLEAPRWHRGELFMSDFYTRRVLACVPDGTVRTVVEVEGQPSGLGWDRRGRLLISSMLDRKLLCFDGQSLVEVADLSGVVDNSCNDMVVDRQGRAYIGNIGDLSDLGRTRLVRVDPDGTAVTTGEELYFPNGCCITPDGTTLLVAETFLGRISALDISNDGSLSNRRVWAEFGSPGTTRDTVRAAAVLPIVPDGICLDAEGCVWVGCATSGGAYRVRQGGEILEKIDTGSQTVIAPALGGEDGTTLFLCCAAPILTQDHSLIHEATLRACQVDVPSSA